MLCFTQIRNQYRCDPPSKFFLFIYYRLFARTFSLCKKEFGGLNFNDFFKFIMNFQKNKNHSFFWFFTVFEMILTPHSSYIKKPPIIKVNFKGKQLFEKNVGTMCPHTILVGFYPPHNQPNQPY